MTKPGTDDYEHYTYKNTEHVRGLFLEGLKKSGTVRGGCEHASITKTTVYRWRKRWAKFRKEWDLAKHDAAEMLLAKAIERAMDGSDRLLMFLLAGLMPNVFGGKARRESIKVKTDGEGETTVTVVRVAPGMLDILLNDSPLLSGVPDGEIS